MSNSQLIDLLPNVQQAKDRYNLLDLITEELIYTDPLQAEGFLSEIKQMDMEAKHSRKKGIFIYRSGFIQNQLYAYQNAVDTLNEALSYFQQNATKEKIDTHIDLAGCYLNIKDLLKVREHLNLANALVGSTPTPLTKAQILCREGMLASRLKEYEQAQQLFLESEKHFLESGEILGMRDQYFLSLIWSGLGWISEKMEHFENAIQYYQKTIDHCLKHDIGSRMTWYYLYLGNTYSAIGKFIEADQFFKKIVEEKHKDVSFYTKAGAYGNLGQLYVKRGRYQKALEMFDKAEALYQQKSGLDDDYNFAALERNKAHLYNEIEDYDSALEALIKAEKYASRSSDNLQLSVIYNDLASFFKEQEDYKSAYEYQVLYSETREKAVNDEKNRSFQDLQIKYETENKERQAKMLQLQANALQMKALRAQMNPHFIFNCLNSIQKYVSENNTRVAEKYLSQFAQLIRKILEHSEHDVISLEDEITFLFDYLAMEKLRFKDELTYRLEIDEQIEEDIMGVPPMIIQPYIENSIVHGIRGVENGEIHIYFKYLNENAILCIVEDNGVGREKASANAQHYQDPQQRSLGTIITQERLDLIQKNNSESLQVNTIDLKNPDGSARGTRVEIRIPVLDIN